MIILKPGSHALRLIMLLLHVGEFPYRSLSMLGDKRTMAHLVNRMSKVHEVRQEGGHLLFKGRLISVSGRARLKTIRLNGYFLSVLQLFLPEYFTYYMDITDDHHFRGNMSNVDRNHRVAETLCMLLLSGIPILPDDQPELQLRRIYELDFEEPAYYNSRCLKVLGGHDLKKTQFTRIIGALFYGTGCYVIYNTRDAAMKWCGRGESKTLQMISRISSMNSHTKNPQSAILYGKDYSTALITLKNLDSDREEAMLFSEDYKMIHFLPMNQFGVKLLQIFITSDWNEQLKSLIFEEDEIRRGYGVFRYDAKVDDTYVLSFLDSDLVKLYRFFDYVRGRGLKWIVYCYEEQQDFLRSYMGEDVNLRVIGIDSILNEFECEWGSII